MADTKLSALTELAVEPADADEIYLNNGGVSNRITYGTLKTALLARANHTGTQLASTISDFATAVAADATVTANTAKVSADDPTMISGLATVTVDGADYLLILDTSVSPNALKAVLASDLLDNATHTGHIAGATSTTLQPAAISDQTLVTAVSGDQVLILDASESPQILKRANVSDFLAGTGDFMADGSVPMTGNLTFAATSPELTVDGRNVSADGAKLDGIEAGATADQTANEILTAIKTVDGTGSGLDADLLDGNEATAFATSAQGSTADAALPKSGGTMTGSIAFGSASPELTVDGRDVSADGAKLDGIEASADVTDATNVSAAGALMKTGGEMSGNITMAGAQTVDGRDLSADGSKLDGISTGADVTEDAVIAAGVITAASGDYLAVQDVSASPQALKRALVSDLTLETIAIACSDETTDLTAATSKAKFRMPYAFTLTAVRASVTTAPAGSSIIVDINEKVGIPSPDVGTSILSTKLYIDATEYSSQDASASPAHQAVISDTALADDSEISIDVDQIGSSTAGAGLKVYLIGYRT